MNQGADPSLLPIEIFERHMQSSWPVQLYNHFHGMSINSHAYVDAIRPDGSVVLNLTGFQAVCIRLEKRAYIQTELVPVAISGYPVEVDIINKFIVLSQLEFLSSNLHKRKNQRVQPKTAVDVNISGHGSIIQAKLADLSHEGIGVFILGTETQADAPLKLKEQVEIQTSLPMTGKEIKLPGKITHVTQLEGTHLQRTGLRCFPDPVTEIAMLDYISCRQAQILQELEAIYKRLLEGQVA